MDIQTDSGNPQSLLLELEFVPEDEYDVDPATVGEVSRDVVAALKNDGYTVQPVYTGERGGFLFAIPVGFMLVGQALMANKDLLIELLKTVQPVIEYVFKEHGKKTASDTIQGPVKVAVEIDGASISVEAPNVESAERLVQLAHKFRTAYPTVAEKVTPRSRIKVRGTVPKRQQRRRR